MINERMKDNLDENKGEKIEKQVDMTKEISEKYCY